MKNLLKSWKTTIAGLIAIVLTMLFAAEIIDIETKTEFSHLSNMLLEHVEGVVALAAGMILLFAKDPDEDEEEV